MKSVLISIKPKWCELIANGTKSVEVRKTKPKLETPFKVYIYCTKARMPIRDNGRILMYEDDLAITNRWGQGKRVENPNGAMMDGELFLNGKVIGEFVCDWVKSSPSWRLKGNTGFCAKRTEREEMLPKMACLSLEEIEKYAGSENRLVYGWHISDLVIYDKPRELSEFYVWKKCNSCRTSGYESTACIYDENCKVPAIITRPPQSWCYVESEGYR